MSNIPKIGWAKFWSNRVTPSQKPNHSQGAGIAGENGFGEWKVSSEIWLGGSSIIFQGNLNISAKSGAPCPYAVVAAPHAEMSYIPYLLEEFLLKDDCLDPRNSNSVKARWKHRKYFAQLRLTFLIVFEVNNVAVFGRVSAGQVHGKFICYSQPQAPFFCYKYWEKGWWYENLAIFLLRIFCPRVQNVKFKFALCAALLCVHKLWTEMSWFWPRMTE